MVRSDSTTDLTLAQLQRLVHARRVEVSRLIRRREKLQRKIGEIDGRIIAASGGSPLALATGPGSRAHNKVSLQTTIHEILSKVRGAISVGEILEKVLATGYQSTSPNFRAIVNQTLIKDPRFVSPSRAMYQLKK